MYFRLSATRIHIFIVVVVVVVIIIIIIIVIKLFAGDRSALAKKENDQQQQQAAAIRVDASRGFRSSTIISRMTTTAPPTSRMSAVASHGKRSFADTKQHLNFSLKQKPKHSTTSPTGAKVRSNLL
jgi:type II secretory pathway pseudopilin PulG